jgi:hypothetical protein
MTCTKCKRDLDSNDFHKKGDRLHSQCKDCRNAAYKIYSQSPKAKNKRNNLRKNRYHSEALFRIIDNHRSTIKNIINLRPNGRNTRYYSCLRCYGYELIEYIENKLTAKMLWSNYGSLWEIDHIVPLKTANNIIELSDLMRYTNLQPISTTEHINKTANE